MKVGFGSVLWGRRIDDLDHMLEVVAACGYKGIEFAQHHEDIFIRENGGLRSVRNALELVERMKTRGLELIGMVSGTLTERIIFLEGCHSPYLYVDRWEDEEAEKALKAGFTLAIHPHWLMPIRKVSEALEKIRRFELGPHSGKVRLLLDTAHATLAEDDPGEMVRNHSSKLAGIHLKSWRPDYGRWSHRYAHGFCPPGEGIVSVEDLMDALHERRYEGWVISEQDHYEQNREMTALQCAEWLSERSNKWNLGIQPDRKKLDALRNRVQINPFYENLGLRGVEDFVVDAVNEKCSLGELLTPPSGAALSGPLSELLLGRALSRPVSHRADPGTFYPLVCAKVRELTGAECVKIWSYNPLLGDRGEFTLLGINAPDLSVNCSQTEIDEKSCLASDFLSHPCVRQYNLNEPSVAPKFSDKVWLLELQNRAPWLLVLPIFNTSNPHQLRYLITIACTHPRFEPTGPDTFEFTSNLEKMGQLDAISWVVAHWTDYLTDEICAAATGHTNYLCGKSKQSVTDFTDSLMDYLQQTFDCNAVTVFLEDMTGTRLKPAGRSDGKLEWRDQQHYYSDKDSDCHTWRAWRKKEMVFSRTAILGKARENRPSNDARDEILFAPLARRGGKCHGVIRLHNKRRPAANLSSVFTDDDAAKLDAIIQTALPHLELLKLQEQQREMLARMMHEFQAPLVAIRGAVDLMQTDLKARGKDPASYFHKDYPDDILQWAELMGGLTRNARIFAVGAQGEPIRPRKTFLLAEVVMPALRQIRPLVPEGIRFDCHQEELKAIPPLWVDRHQMQQVFFNLLANAIKYRGLKDFIRVRISGGPFGSSFAIFFEDWGTGVEEEDKEEVFYPGYRSARAVASDVAGQGLGLFLVRSILNAHGGTISVRSCRSPTTFEISLPSSLRYSTPSTPRSTS